MEFTSFDGTRIAITEMGDGPPILLLHGLFSSAEVNWVRYGTAKRLVEAGYRLIMPDHRGHGKSGPPQGDSQPDDVLAMDAEALIAHLGLGDDFLLCGYSLGGRTAMRLLARGLRPKGVILAGMGLEGILGQSRRFDWFINLIENAGKWERGSPQFMADAFMRANVAEPERLIPVLNSQVPTSLETLQGFDLPILVVAGAEDDDNGSAPKLVEALPNATYAEIPGNHMSSVTKPELAQAMIDFLKRLDG